MHVSMRTSKRNPSVAIKAIASVMQKRNVEAAGGSPKGSYAVVVAGFPSTTRSSRAKITRIQRGNTGVAAKAPAARDTKGALTPAPAPAAAAAEVSPSRETPPRTGENASPARSRNDDVADEAPAARDAKGASPPAPAPAAGAIAEEKLSLAVVARLAEKGAEIVTLKADLKAQVAKPLTKTQVEKRMKKAPRVSMSTEAAGVPVGSGKY